MTYIVGDNGPEIFVVPADGRVFSTEELARLIRELGEDE